MCGFSGFIDLAQSIPEADSLDVAARMADAIAHRGPDNADTWSDPPAGFAVGFRRVSIIDLSPAGNQPMVSAGGRIVIVFNGEVYNAPELRGELAAQGAVFRGHSDTEVILAAFERWGIERSLPRFVGMFAIALWDRAERKLSLIRDRIGKKPLYYGRIADTVFFGSQPKSFFPHPGWRAEIDRDSLAGYLRFGYVPCPHSIYKGLEQVRPAEWIDIAGGQVIKREIYWNAPEVAETFCRKPLELTDEEALARFETLLGEAVRQRLISDVPLGAFLSGGVDSSAVVALMQRHGGKRVKTFSIGFDQDEFDESSYARAVAAHLGTEHHEFRVRPQDAIDTVPTIPHYYDEPFADASQVPTCILSAFTRKHVTVALSGDGGDELMSGYTRYEIIERVSKMAALLPQTARSLAAAMLAHTPGSLYRLLESLVPAKYGSLPLKLRTQKLVEYLGDNSEERMFRQIVSLWNEPQQLVRGGHEPSNELWDGAMRERIGDPIRRMQLIDTLTYLPDDILVKVDRASMAVGLEVRVPLTDHRLVEFGWQLPRRFHVRHGRRKWLLRELLRRYVPDALIERPKAGFVFPLSGLLRGPLRDWAEDLLDAKRVESEGLLDPAPIRDIWQQQLTGDARWQYRLWGILMFQAWKRRWIDQGAGAASVRGHPISTD